ncbi:hypothetical protein BUL40_15620 [Croceivirga radicis]|uniref:Uncharacterized protein n=1 Tax=Croceivirga radicis TaxID=1929488 RepID=A0A1V6LMU3_9FLAO|nr:hypothetical protein [Croceivirga radicis]OQD41505.1 hypothetical protein BUL40_15620 [Croceivirga radicis]
MALIPTLVLVVSYLVGFTVELFKFKKMDATHTTQDVCNARKFFIYMALPIFSKERIENFVYALSGEQLKAVRAIYGQKPFSKSLGYYVPLSKKYDALTTLHHKEQIKLTVV